MTIHDVRHFRKVFFAIAFFVSAVSSLAAGDAKRTTVIVGNVRVGFTLELGEWRKSCNAKTPGGIGSERAFVPTIKVPHGQMKSLSVMTNANVITAVWKGHPICGDNFTVTAKMTLQPDGGFEYTDFEYTGNESGQYVQWLAFPEIIVPRTKKTAILQPRFGGSILHPDWRKMGTGTIVTDQGMILRPFNFIAAIEDGKDSHFLDMRGDARLYFTHLQVTVGSLPKTVVLRNLYAQPITEATAKAGKLPYTGVYAPYRGGWYEAARLHREWIEKQPWFIAASRRDFSKLRAIDLWMWSRGNIAVSVPPVHWFMKETGLKVALDWYWWHGIPYDTNFPYFWPPRDGENAFRAAVKRMKDAGAFVQVYTNGMAWDENDPRWADGGIESTCVKADGKIWGTKYNRFVKHSLAHCCGEAPKFQSMMRRLEKTLASTGLDGVYMDQIACTYGLCFNPRHKHAPGDSRAFVEGFRRYVDAVRADNPGFYLSSEAPSEAYIDKFESFILLYSSWERNHLGVMPHVEPVPAASVIYRGAGVLFGSFATPSGAPAWDPMWGKRPDKDEDVEKLAANYPDQFAVEFARGIIWGIQPLVHNFTMKDVVNPRIAKDIQFMKDSARFYHNNKEFLFDGEMLKPAKIHCARKRVEFLSAGCYTRVKDARKYVQKALPCVFHSEWRAPDGRRAAILVNWSQSEQKYTLDLGGGQVFSGVLGPREWRKILF